MKKVIKVLSLLLGGGVLLSCLSSSFSDAATVTRKSNIKSHGTFQSNDATGTQEVLLDSADLRYLADECDKLEQVIEGLSLINNPNISYTRHHHTGSQYSYGGCYTNGYHVHSGNTYSCGGCYTVGYHEHSGCAYHIHSSSCYTDKTVHTHSGSCYTQVRIHTHTDSCPKRENEVHLQAGEWCPMCGRVQTPGEGGWHTCWAWACPKPEFKSKLTCTRATTERVLSCTKSEGYQCGFPDNRWRLGCGNSPNNRYRPACGWNENEIMEAHIVFSK